MLCVLVFNVVKGQTYTINICTKEELALIKSVEDFIGTLPELDKITLADATKVKSVYDAYNKLTGPQKALISADKIKKVTEAYNKIVKLQEDAAKVNNNKALAGDPSTYSATADAMIIGNGANATDGASNCFRITFDGNVYGLSSYNSYGADYSEFFEWQDENPSAEDRVGHFVTLDGEKIRYANDGDYVVGITSGNPSVIGDHPSESWEERYLRDVFGRLQYEDVTIPAHDEKDKSGKVIRTIPEHTETHFKVNPDYDPAKEAEYANREKRPEWATVGMLGKLVVIDDGTCEVNGYCKPKNGTATKSDTGYRVLARLDETHIKVLMK